MKRLKGGWVGAAATIAAQRCRKPAGLWLLVLRLRFGLRHLLAGTLYPFQASAQVVKFIHELLKAVAIRFEKLGFDLSLGLLPLRLRHGREERVEPRIDDLFEIVF